MRSLIEQQKPVFFFSFLIILLFITVYWIYSPDKINAEDIHIQKASENFDIRTASDKHSRLNVQNLIQRSAQTSSQILQLKKDNFTAEKLLKKTSPNIIIERNDTLHLPEIISFDTKHSASFRSTQNFNKRDEILLDFVRQNSHLFGFDLEQIDQLNKSADYTNPNGILSYVHFQQKINNIPVFGGELKAGFSKNNEIIRVINNLAPNLVYGNLTEDFGKSEQAVVSASNYINQQLDVSDIKPINVNQNDQKQTFQSNFFTDVITAEKVYFPLDYGVAVNAWRVLFWTSTDAFYVVVDAQDGTLLWRKNITEYQTQPATFNVYGNNASLMKTSDNPAPCSPGCTDPNNCPQSPLISRMDFTLIGNESNYNFNDLGWIPDTGLPVRTPANPNITDGNNCEAGLDIDGMNGVDPNGHAIGNPFRFFSYNYNPAPGNPTPGDEPTSADFRNGSITNGFHTVNRWHDELYLLGFTEQAGNFQHFNFGRGGSEGDRISFEVQDFTGTNGANFSTPADGGRGRMQSFVWTNPTPDRDGALDNQVVVHELTHGLSGRLHGNTVGLSTNMARGMGEGWSDFYSLALLSEPTDSQCGTYPVGSYISYQIIDNYANHYYGIRRYPTARINCLGTNNLPYNPLTFGNLNAGNCTNIPGAFPRGPLGSTTCDQVHNAGEIWSQALWEVRGLLIEQHGFNEGNKRALQYITDGMKLSPLNPNMLQSRDAIVAAANASDANDVQWILRGFALRGMGISAQILSVSPANVIENFDYIQNVSLRDPLNFVELNGNINGFPEPGETLQFQVSLENDTGADVSNVNANINGKADVFYGTIPNGTFTTKTIVHTIPIDAECGSFYEINVNITSNAGTKTETRSIRIGDFSGTPITFENNSTINVPSSGNTSGPAQPYPSTINVSGLTGRQVIKLELPNLNHTWVGDVDILLEGPGGQKMIIMSDAFSSSNQTGTVVSTLTLSDSATDIMPATGIPPTIGNYKPTNHGVTDIFDAPAPGEPYNNPLPAGNSTFSTVFGTDGSTMNGVWKLWINDDSSGDTGTIAGWKITFESYFCVVCATICPPLNNRADFDGDGRSDISVFRPSEGNWYLNQSTNGFSVIKWGLADDVPVPSDFDGDGRTDFAIFRANSDANQPDFYILNSSGFTFSAASWGLPGDIPSTNDFDGDGRADLTIFRPTQNKFYVLQSNQGVLISRPMPEGLPVAGDFDGDGKGDFATYNNGQWFISQSSLNHQSGVTYLWGLSSDKVVSDDYDGDGKDDIAVFRPSNGIWYIIKSSGGESYINFGTSGDIPVPADYDGDGKSDVAVYRNGVWYIDQTTSGIYITQYGLSTDLPIQEYYLP